MQVEAKLALRDREHLDLQEAYKEKMRKCIAWEKAYAQLKNQNQGVRPKASEAALAVTQEINNGVELHHGAQLQPSIHNGLIIGPTGIEHHQQQQPIASGLSAQPSGLRSQQLAPHLAPGLPGAPQRG